MGEGPVRDYEAEPTLGSGDRTLEEAGQVLLQNAVIHGEFFSL